MTEKELQNRYNLLLQQLELINRHWDDFIDKLGENGCREKINEILDEIIHIRKKLDGLNLKNEK